MRISIPESAKHVFFTAVGYDDFRNNSQFATEERSVTFATLIEDEYLTKSSEHATINSLPSDRELEEYISFISKTEE